VSSWLNAGPLGGYALAGLLLTLGALLFKLAAVPFHGYVADVYEGASAPLAAALAFLPKLAGAVGIIQILSLISWQLPAALFWVMWIVAAATMTVGNVLALMQTNVKRLLAYSSVAHSGYMLIGLLAGPGSAAGPLSDGLAALLFYVGVYAVMNLGAFAFVACLASAGAEGAEREHIAGSASRHPLAALGLTLCMFSLIGLPPTAGFMGKLYLLSSAFSASEGPFGGALLLLAVIGAVNSAIGAAYYLRVVAWCWCEPAAPAAAERSGAGLRAIVAVCAAAMLVLFVWPQGLRQAAGRATAALRREALQPLAGGAAGSSELRVPGSAWAATVDSANLADRSETGPQGK
jgi:NADH-quinone oxidoreductase subunit N